MGVFLIVTVALAIVEKSSAQCSAKDVLAEPTPPDVPNAGRAENPLNVISLAMIF